MIIPESTIQLTDIYSHETINRFIHEADDVLSQVTQIELVGQLKTVRHFLRTDAATHEILV